MTRSLLRIVAVASLIACAALAVPSASSAKTAVGIGHQAFDDLFTNPNFQSLGMKKARIVVPWNVAQKRGDRSHLDKWLAEARRTGVEPFVHFASATGSRCPGRPCRLPTVRQYTNAFRAFRKRWRFVRVIGVWNEANHRSQPTFCATSGRTGCARRPKAAKRAAQYFNAVRKNCRGCRIVAADIIDETNMGPWLKVFKRHARGERLWGLHNYRDTNPRRGQIFGGTRKLLKLVRGQVWMTETGGLVKFVLPNRRTLFRFSERRANTAVKRMFRLAKRYRRRVTRLYIYNWRAPIKKARFDSGLLTFNGKPRPAFFTVQQQMKTRFFGP